MIKKATHGGYSYAVTKEQIKKWQAVSPEMRLEWLEEINRFLYEAQSPKTREIWQKFRRGDI